MLPKPTPVRKNVGAIAAAMFFYGVLVLPMHVSAATYNHAPHIKQFSVDQSASGTSAAVTNMQYTETDWFHSYDAHFTGGADVAVADLGGDGVAEMVTSLGVGGEPLVRTFRTDGSFINQFQAYEETMTDGITLATGDFDGDGVASIVTAPGEGSAPYIRVFKGTGMIEHTAGFYAAHEEYRGGIRVAAGDVDGDGIDEIVTGTGYDTTAQVKVFEASGEVHSIEYQPFAEEFIGGVDVAVGEFDGDTTQEEIAVSVASDGQAWVKVYRYDEARTLLHEWKVFDEGSDQADFTGGVFIESGDIDADGTDDLVVSIAGKGGPQVYQFSADGKKLGPGFEAYAGEFHGGVRTAVGNIDIETESVEIITAPAKPRPEWNRPGEKRAVRVNLSEQRLYAYEDGYLIRSFLISGGLPATPTPVGEFRIQREVYSKHYYGDDYNYPGTLYNMQFYPSYYLHGAYWHNGFGSPRSHGCINIDYVNAEWIWHWIEVGDLVVTEW